MPYVKYLPSQLTTINEGPEPPASFPRTPDLLPEELDEEDSATSEGYAFWDVSDDSEDECEAPVSLDTSRLLNERTEPNIAFVRSV